MDALGRFYDRFQGLPEAIVATAIVVGALFTVIRLLGLPWALALGLSLLALAMAVLVFYLWRKRGKPLPPPPPTNPQGVPLHDPEGFFSRTAELSEVVAALQTRRSLLIHGEPGIGKTELAIQSLRAPTVAQAYQGRLHYIDLQGQREISLASLCDDVARSLNAQAVLQATDVDQKVPILIANLGDPPPLIVFNNADGPAAVAAVAAFRRRVMDGPLLVTSRDAIPGMTTLELGPLGADAAFRPFAQYAGRAPAVEERKAVDDILALLQNNPLAITVAAPLLPSVGAAELLRLLQARPSQALGPVWRAFDLSWSFLSPKEQRLLAALSIFAGPDFSGEAVQSLFDEDITLELGNLVGASLLRRNQETGRYSLHPLLKQYAWEKATVQEKDALHLRLAAYYADFTGAHDQPSEDHLNAVALEFSNIRGCVAWCLSRPSEPLAQRLLTDLVIRLQRFMDVRGYWIERGAWGEAAVEAAKALRNDQRLAIVAGNLANASQQRRELQRTTRAHLDAREAFQRLGDERNVATALHQLGVLAQAQGRLEEARDLYNQSLDITKRLGDQQGIAQTLHQMGIMAHGQGRLAEARDLYQQSLDITQRLGDQRGIAISLHQLGLLAQGQGRLEEARDLYRQSLDIAKRLGDQQGLAATLHMLGNLAYSQGRLQEARDLYNQSLDITKRLGDQQGLARTLHMLGNLAYSQGRLEEARDLYGQSLDIKKRLGDQQGLAQTFGQLGRLAENQANFLQALTYYQQALEMFQRLGAPDAAVVQRDLQRVREATRRQDSNG